MGDSELDASRLQDLEDQLRQANEQIEEMEGLKSEN